MAAGDGASIKRVQARDEVGFRAEHMGAPRRAASATWNPQCEGGREGVSIRDIKGCGVDRGHGLHGVLHRLRGTPMWMLRGWRTQQGRGYGSVGGVCRHEG